MDEKSEITVDQCLHSLSDTLTRASGDLRNVVPAIDQARAEIATHNTSMPRAIIRDAERVIKHLRRADECLRDVVKDLEDR